MSGLVLVDTSIWADHIDHSDELLSGLLGERRILMHPYVIGELAMGNLKHRARVLRDLHWLPTVVPIRNDEVLHFIADHELFGLGIGYTDAHLLASVQLTPYAKLWTRDRRLHEAAERLRVNFDTPKLM